MTLTSGGDIRMLKDMQQNQDAVVLEYVELMQEAIEDLATVFTPHDGQRPIIHHLFVKGKRLIFIECGRKFGKTEIILYILYRWAMTVKNGAFYYIAPFKTQAREIIWASKRVQKFLNLELREKWGVKVNNTQMRVTIGRTDSFIKLEGADNYDAARGFNPHGAVYEEFKDHNVEFHAAFDPNLATYEAPLVIIGTPPPEDDPETNLFCAVAEEAKERKDGVWFNMPSWLNPHISTAWLKRKRGELFKKADEHEWYLEYCAKRYRGGKMFIFPMLDAKKHKRKHDVLLREIKRDRKRIIWQCIADPASSSVFGVLFRAINPYTRTTYRLDEIYESNQREMSARKMWAKIYVKIMDLHPHIDDWEFIYDEAATWWTNEMMNEFNIYWTPTQKSENKKDNGISFIKDQMINGLFLVSERCHYFWWECSNYKKDKNGKIPKENDHLIDCDRYGNHAAYLDTVERDRPPVPDPDDLPRGFKIEDDLRADDMDDDWTEDLVGDL